MPAIELFSHSLYSDANLLSYYRLEGNSNDAKGLENGTDTGMSYSSTGGQFNQYGDFNGTSSRIALSVGNAESSSWSVSAWVYPTATGTRTIYSNGSSYDASGTWSGYQVFYDGSYKVWCYNFYSNSAYNNPTATNAMTPNAWNHIVVTHSSTGNITHYLNGVANGSVASGGATVWTQSAYRSRSVGVDLKGNAGSPGMFHSGRLDDVAIFSRELTAQEVASLYNFGQTISVSDTITLTETSTNLRARLLSVSDTITLSESVSAFKGLVISVSDTIGLTDTLSALRGLITSISDTITLTESLTIRKLWETITKTATNWTNGSKNSTSFSNQSKNSTSWTNQSKS